jgi:hypothetical protein
MESGEHWFHTEAQMRFLDDWIRSCEGGNGLDEIELSFERGTNGNGTTNP